MRPLLGTLSGIFSGRKVSDNVGAPPIESRDTMGKRGRRGQGESTVRTVGAQAETVALAGRKDETTAIVGSVPSFLTKRYAGEIGRAIDQASKAAQQNGRPIGVVLSEQSKNILRGFDKRSTTDETAQKYLRTYNNMLATGRTPLEMSTTRQAFNFYRSAWRFGLLRDIETLGRASEQARKAGNLDSAKRRTQRQFRFAIALESSTADTWAPKAKAIREKGGKVKSKSKNPHKGGPVVPNRAVAIAPLMTKGRQQRTIERHAERLSIIEAGGFRPAEMLKGIKVKAVKVKGKKPTLQLIAEGAKWDGINKGQQYRIVAIQPKTASEKALYQLAVEQGGDFICQSTSADMRSLNRALAKGLTGLSCYSYRHAFGGSLKRACLAGTMSREEAAQAMGHRSTVSLSYYGQPSKSAGRKVKAKASDDVRPHKTPMNKVAMGKEKTPIFPTRKVSAINARTTMVKPVGPLAKGPRPPR